MIDDRKALLRVAPPLAVLAAVAVLAVVPIPESLTRLAATQPTLLFAKYDDLANARFEPMPKDPYETPNLESISLPDFPGAWAVWGSTGRDARGRLWLGVSAHDQALPSARLVEYLPETGQTMERGNAVAELASSNQGRDGESQMKIHSKIFQAADGYLYFASMDEQGERTDGSKLPTWGSHFWRKHPNGDRWEHLFRAPEGLIAVAGYGLTVYALGFFDHTLYQYDATSGSVRSVRVGAAGGHITRNFLVDERGHAYVPRLRESPSAPGGMATTLVEFDATLKEVGETPIKHYTQSKDDESHGITGVQPMADRSLVFVTDRGFLYRIAPNPNGRATVNELGWFHPGGERYASALSTWDGRRFLVGVARLITPRNSPLEWVVHDLERRTSKAQLLVIPTVRGTSLTEVQLYGSTTRDNAGNILLGGAANRDGKVIPIAFLARMRIGKSSE